MSGSDQLGQCVCVGGVSKGETEMMCECNGGWGDGGGIKRSTALCFTLTSGRFGHTNGCLTHKSFAFIFRSFDSARSYVTEAPSK